MNEETVQDGPGKTTDKLPVAEGQKEATRLSNELVDAILTVPDFKEKAAQAFARGENQVVFTHEGENFSFSRWTPDRRNDPMGYLIKLMLGEPEALKPHKAPTKPVEEYILLGISNNPPEARIQYGYDHNSSTAVKGIEGRIQSFRQIQAPPAGQV